MTLQDSIKTIKAGKQQFSLEDTMKQLLDEKDNISLFNNIDNKEIKQLIKNIHLVQFLSNQFIFKEDEVDNHLIYFLLDGYVNIIKKQDIYMQKITKLETGALLGEMSHLLLEKRSATCIAGSEGVIAICFEFDENVDPKISEKLYKNIATDLLKKIEQNKVDFKIEEMDLDKTLTDYYKRFAKELANIIKKYNSDIL